ncbi:gamma-glutamylaminecyclotransferase-like [Scleropages formosus]|uniref:Gamma-glutamylaminecyclotransferase n=1 Tax=Scleropages formosus TaxID=113540 RepID=A0A8C9U944_SCLFO|nr:gamma-glutamylaminecyclotransferase [Scleropages formosus]XP_018584670.2 gamma-glutamylaminecyclotransferase [Scleropages formosus]
MGRTKAALLLLLQAHVTLEAHMTHVFVYGTLKNSQPNFFQMIDKSNGKATFCGGAHTVERFPLVIAGKYNIPFLLNVPGKGHRVKGEVYCVDSQMLQFLDKFEGCPHMYQRTSVDLEVEDWVGESGTCGSKLAPGSRMKAFVYSTTTYQPQWLTLPYWENYDAYGDHGLAFVSRENRD